MKSTIKISKNIEYVSSWIFVGFTMIIFLLMILSLLPYTNKQLNYPEAIGYIANFNDSLIAMWIFFFIWIAVWGACLMTTGLFHDTSSPYSSDYKIKNEKNKKNILMIFENIATKVPLKIYSAVVVTTIALAHFLTYTTCDIITNFDNNLTMLYQEGKCYLEIYEKPLIQISNYKMVIPELQSFVNDQIVKGNFKKNQTYPVDISIDMFYDEAINHIELNDQTVYNIDNFEKMFVIIQLKFKIKHDNGIALHSMNFSPHENKNNNLNLLTIFRSNNKKIIEPVWPNIERNVILELCKERERK